MIVDVYAVMCILLVYSCMAISLEYILVPDGVSTFWGQGYRMYSRTGVVISAESLQGRRSPERAVVVDC